MCTDTFVVQSFFIDSKPISSKTKCMSLYVVLIKNESTYLCRMQSTVTLSNNSSTEISLFHFLPEAVVPLEDCVSVQPSVLDSSRLNILLSMRATGRKQSFAPEDLSWCYDSKIKPRLKQRGIFHKKTVNDDCLKQFMDEYLDFNFKEELRSNITAKYFNKINVMSYKFMFVPKSPKFSFLTNVTNVVDKAFIESISDFVVVSDNVGLEIEKRKIAKTVKFSFKAVFLNNSEILAKHLQENTRYLISDGVKTCIVSPEEEIIAICQTHDDLKSILNADDQGLITNHSAIRRTLAPSYKVQRNMTIRGNKMTLYRELLKFSSRKSVKTQEYLSKKGVLYFDKDRLPAKSSKVYVHDFKNFYATIIVNQFDDYGIVQVFQRLRDARERVSDIKSLITKLFGCSKHYYPRLFHLTLNAAVHIMCKTYLKNKTNVFAMCKDSFFTLRETLKVPVKGYTLVLDHVLENFKMININTYCGIDVHSKRAVIKGLQSKGFDASGKVVNVIYELLANRQSDEALEIEPSVNQLTLCEKDFFLKSLPIRKPSDHLFYGLDLAKNCVYAKPSLGNELYQLSRITPSDSIGPNYLVGKVDVQRYVNEILIAIIQFARQFGYEELIDPEIMTKASLFLKTHILIKIFHKTNLSSIPGLSQLECQLC